MLRSLLQISSSALLWLPQDRDAAKPRYGSRYWAICAAFAVAEVALLILIIRYIPFTNVDYRAYIQQSRRFLNTIPAQDGYRKLVEEDIQGNWKRAATFVMEAIGWSTHQFEEVERRYSSLIGETGPLVYPAFHLYIYTIIDLLHPLPSHLLFSGPEGVLDPAQIHHVILDKEDKGTFLPLQMAWAAVYMVTMGLMMWIYRQVARGRAYEDDAGRKKIGAQDSAPILHAPPTFRSLIQHLLHILNSPAQLIHLVPLLVLSKRLHSIYVLRLFNDPLAVLFLYASVVSFMTGWWNTGSTLFSLALGIKMNILLYLPGLMVLQFQYRGLIGLLGGVVTILAVQVALPAPFFLANKDLAVNYFHTAFDFSRKFVFKWSVNLAFLGKDLFEQGRVSKMLLATQGALLLLFAWFKWSNNVPGGTIEVLDRGLRRSRTRAPLARSTGSRYHIPLVLFTSNFIGIVCARSLHYQFHSWYAHQLPLLLWCTRSRLWVCLALWLMIQVTWDSFPPSKALSQGMLAAHLYILGRLFMRT